LAEDAIEIRKGWRYVKHMNMLVGGENHIAENEARDFFQEKNPNELAVGFIVQYFLISLDGSFCLPLISIPRTSQNRETEFKFVEGLAEMMKRLNHELKLVCSDGFGSVISLKNKIEEKLGILYLFDPSHVVKLCRNAILNHEIEVAKNGVMVRFDVDILIKLWHANSELGKFVRETISVEAIDPIDRQSFGPVREVMKKEFYEQLEKDPDLPTSCLGEFFRHLDLYYSIFNSTWETIKKQIEEIQKCEIYFQKISSNKRNEPKLSSELSVFVSTSLKNAKQLLIEEPNVNLPALNTTMVENCFSLVRSKQQYPDILQYYEVFHGAYREMIKRAAFDNPVPMIREESMGCYPTFTSKTVSINLLKNFNSKEERREATKTKNRGSPDDVTFCRKIARNFPPTRRVTSVRDATASVSSINPKAEPGRAPTRTKL
jgi:hypothetical protein